jgi:beta-xylosidase
VDPTALFGFGHGLTYTSFEWRSATLVNGAGGDGVTEWDVAGDATVEVTVCNTGERAGTEVVQLYLHDPVAQVTRPVQRLIGFTRVPLEAGAAARVRFTVPADLTSFTGLAGRRIVEPGDVELRLARSSADVVATLGVRLVGTERETGPDRALGCAVVIEEADLPAEVTQ